MENFKIRADDLDPDEKVDLEKSIKDAERRMRERARIWIPEKGEKRAVKVLEVTEEETEIGPTKFFILEDLKEGQRLRLLAHAALEKNLELRKLYLLEYQGKVYVEKLERECHSWLWEEIK